VFEMIPSIDPLYLDIGDELQLGTLTDVAVIQTLWSGYGELVRLTYTHKSVIAKHIRLPETPDHPRGWNTDRSHQRKVHSYEVEVNWYQNFSDTIDDRCRIPQGLKCFQGEGEWLIVMEDLAAAGFTTTVEDADTAHLSAALHWLANFHARYMGTHSEHLWEHGTYWHLQTRPDELEALDDERLKVNAARIDAALNKTTHRTIVHGDAKLANFCFTADGTLAAAVDFQYVGHGCGMKDVAYFMSSAIEPEDCGKMEMWVLDTYFAALENAIRHYHPYLDSTEIESEWRPLFAVAWADFQRFVKGWSPGHYKINAYTEALTKRALDFLASKA
jgi:thiamine kinase-like enzyme